MNTNIRYYAGSMLLALGLLLCGGAASAAPGTLAGSPLFLQSGAVQPNIFFMIDDSGSMDWEDLLNKGTFSPGTAILASSTLYNPPAFYGNEWNRRLARLFCRGFNVMAYDPTVTYTPWQGTDSSGAAFGNMTITSARSNPYQPGSTVDISDHYYWAWNDADGDNEYDGPADPGWWGGDPASPTDECGDVSSLAGGVAVNSLPAVGTASNPNSQRNYANWYTYYRKREYVVKRALSEIIMNSTARAGLATINGQDANSLTGNSSDIFSLVADIDDISTPVDATAKQNKEDLLASLFRIDSNFGTPLRSALDRVGRYFEGNLPAWGASPIQSAANGGECQQNFAILMSDGQWNGGPPGVGNTDGDNSSAFDGGLYADNVGDTLADVAMKYYETDLSPLANRVPTIGGVDENSAQHMVTYTVAFGLDGTLGDGQLPGQPGFTGWPTPTADSPETIDDMRHAAYNGRGQFLSAKNPQSLIDSLGQYIADIQLRTGTAAAVSFNSTSLQAGTRVFQATFNSSRWSGDLLARDIVVDAATGIASLSGTAWKASDDIDSRTPASRQIVTYDAGSASGVSFEWSSLGSSQKLDLRTDSSGGLDTEASGMARLGFLRGDRDCEIASPGTCRYPATGSDSNGQVFTSKSLRQRRSALGDIVHSSPFFVGPPSTPYPDSIEPASPYSAFAITNSNRAGMTYVGANDGMLHAFDDNGEEVFAYVPASLFSTAADEGLHYLSDPDYVHRYYVDLSPTVQDAYITVGGVTAWRSVLVGALRGGGKGLFAIDVTDPSALAANAASRVLWEFTDDNLGYTFSDIRIGKMSNGKWAAVFGNGYNNDPAGDGRARLYIVYLDGSNIASPVVIDTGVGTLDSASKDCANPASDCNGLATPKLVDLNGDGTIDRIYAGDLHGNLWAFDVSDKTDTSNWVSAYGASPLFRACSATPCTASNRQPITVEPDVEVHPTRVALATEPNLLVFFGTGQYLVQSDNADTAVQSFYGVWDSGVGAIERDVLKQQVLSIANDPALGEVRLVSDYSVNYSVSGGKGWFIDFDISGERSVASPLAFGSIVFFNTVIPTAINSDACSVGGSGWLMAVDLLTGGEPKFIPIDVNNDGVFDFNDQVGADMVVGTQSDGVPAESRFISNKRVTADSTGAVRIENIQPKAPSPPARMSWSELKP